MPDAINYKIGQVWYGEVAVPFYPASGDYTTFQNNLTLDIDYGYPLQGDAEENHNGPLLVGHPNPAPRHPIFHWFAIYGYSSSGANSSYVDSVYGATAVTWYQQVTSPSSTLSSNKITDIVGDRGYNW